MFSRALMQSILYNIIIDKDIIPNSQDCIEEIKKINNDFNFYQSTGFKSSDKTIHIREQKAEKAQL